VKNYELLDEDVNGHYQVLLTDNKYKGIIYTYGRVRLLEEDDHLRVQFEYNIHENPVGNIQESEFRNHIGDILVDMLEENLLKNNIVYTGGVNENRKEDSNESDLR
jgi:hypothetical protein